MGQAVDEEHKTPNAKCNAENIQRRNLAHELSPIEESSDCCCTDDNSGAWIQQAGPTSVHGTVPLVSIECSKQNDGTSTDATNDGPHQGTTAPAARAVC